MAGWGAFAGKQFLPSLVTQTEADKIGICIRVLANDVVGSRRGFTISAGVGFAVGVVTMVEVYAPPALSPPEVGAFTFVPGAVSWM